MNATLLRFFLRTLCAALLALVLAPAHANVDLVGDDTDLFTRNPTLQTQIPNVLIVLDNTANWAAADQGWPSELDPSCTNAGFDSKHNKQGDAELCAIYHAIEDLTDQVNVGLMLFNTNNKGGYIRFGMKPMNEQNKGDLKTLLKSMNTQDDDVPANNSYDNVMNDAFRYFNSLATMGGTGAASSSAESASYQDASTKTLFKFFSSANDTSCGFDYIIFIGNAFPNKENVDPNMTNAVAALSDPSVVANKTLLNTTGANADVWARFMFQYGVKVANGVYRHITTYTLNVCKNQCASQQGPEQRVLMKSMASASQGKYFEASTFAKIKTSIEDVFSEVQAVNSVFAATTLPVSINVRGTNLNQVYIGVFRPDPQLSPRWLGNLKHYRLGVNAITGGLELIDALGVPAVNLNTGFISNTATSIWTETTANPATDAGFWAFRAPNYAATDVGKDEDGPDGDLVEKGGAAQKIRQLYDFPDSTTAKTRNIFTCVGPCAAGELLSDTPFYDDGAQGTVSGITPQMLRTFAATQVLSITASGQTATVTTNGNHNFPDGSSVVITGATPSLFNGTFDITTAGGNSFTYSTSPNTADANHAYATWPGYTLIPGVDKVIVTSATPTVYNVGGTTGVDISAVPGNINQFSYALASNVSQAASGYSVSAVRRVDNVATAPGSSKVTWSNNAFGVGTVTMNLSSHGFSTGDLITVLGTAGVTDAAFIVPAGVATGLITRIDADNFTYVSNGTPAAVPTVTKATANTATPSGFTQWANNDLVLIEGGTGGNAPLNSATGGDNITLIGDASNNTFDYDLPGTASGGIVLSPATGFTAKRIRTSGTQTWEVLSITNDATADTYELLLQFTSQTPAENAGQQPRPFVAGDLVQITNLLCFQSNGTTRRLCHSSQASDSDSTFEPTATTVGTYDSGTQRQTVKFTSPATQFAQAIEQGTGATVVFTVTTAKPTYSLAVNVDRITTGSATVNALGTIYAYKSGDITANVTSLTSQGFATGTITAALETSADVDEYSNLIAWVRGQDNIDQENQNGMTSDIRAMVHGDVLHSRPAVVNYNRFSNDDDVYIFYGANDGMLHAIKGGTLDDGGEEQWAFIPKEFFGSLKRLRDQTPTISSSNPRNYFFDGPIGIYTLDSNTAGSGHPDNKIDASIGTGNTDKVHLFVAMRRGGRMIYALDVTSPTTPKLLWKKGCQEALGNGTTVNNGLCDAGFGEMGQTWSEPKLGYVNAFSQLVLMVGAGFDANVEDFQPCVVTAWNSFAVQGKTNVVFPNVMNESTANCPPVGSSSSTRQRTMGRGIFILDAANGDILWTAGHAANSPTRVVPGMNYSIAADLAVLRNRSNTANRPTTVGFENVPNGFVDRIYATDTGGNVWRFDVTAADTDDWVVTKLASIAEEAPVSLPAGQHVARNYRKFLNSVDVVYATASNNQQYDAVLVGSGDREHPFDLIVQNRFYMFKDTKVTSYTVADVPLATQPTPPLGVIVDTASSTQLVDVTTGCDGACQTALLTSRGWKMRYTNSGEKTVGPATTAAGSVIFNSFEPKDDSVTGTANICTSTLGTARQYGISFVDGSATNIFSNLPAQYVPAGGKFALFAGGGFLPTPVPVVVKIGDKYYQTVVAGVQTTNPGGLKLQSRLRTYWYRQIE